MVRDCVNKSIQVVNRRFLVVKSPKPATKNSLDGKQNDLFMHFLAMSCNGWLGLTSFLHETILSLYSKNKKLDFSCSSLGFASVFIQIFRLSLIKSLQSIHNKSNSPCLIFTTSIWDLSNTSCSNEICFASLQSMEIYHYGKFAYFSTNAGCVAQVSYACSVYFLISLFYELHAPPLGTHLTPLHNREVLIFKHLKFGMPIWIWLLMNRYRMPFVQSPTPTPSMHQWLTNTRNILYAKQSTPNQDSSWTKG